MESCLSHIIETTKGFLLRPVETFQQNAETSLSSAFQYYAVLVVFYAVLCSIFQGLFLSFGQPFPYMGGLIGFAIGIFVLFLIFTIIAILLISIFFQGLFHHIFVLLVGGEGGIAQTLKACLYSTVPTLVLGWIPIINIIAAIWSIVLMILGIRELHKISTTRAIAAVILPVVLFIMIAVMFVLCMIAFFGLGIAAISLI